MALFATIAALSSTPCLAFKSLLSKDNLYAHEILDNPEVASAVKQLIGKKYSDYSTSMSVSPPAVIVDNRYVFGQGCWPHQCSDINALIVVDVASRKVWAALTENKVGRAWPTPVVRWPAEIREIVSRNYRQ